MTENQELKKAGLKVTLPRIKVLQVLEQHADHHLTAEEVYKALIEQGEEVGLATVYRVLTQFETAGLVARHHFDSGQSVFELEKGDHHDHLVCVKCGKVIEFQDDLIEKRQQEVAKNLGFHLTDHSHYLYGECAACQKAG